MKKLLILLLSTLSLTVFPQQKKQVAILEPVAVTNEVSLMHRSMVRGEMVKAIGRQEGYAAFTRTDIDKIVNEQNFQQSGMVDDDTRIRIGDMKGVDYLCVTKVSKEGNNYYMEAVLVHVESGEITQPATQFVELSGGSLANLLTACENLAAELVGGQNQVTAPSTPTTPTHDNTSSSMNTTKRVAVFVTNMDDVPYGVLQQVHTCLMYAISNSNGYTVRDVASGQSPHSSGANSTYEMITTGKMIGADYILMAEVARYDDISIIITTKTIDVETGGILRVSSPMVVNKNSNDINEACLRISKTLPSN